jgi:hypothetical protein
MLATRLKRDGLDTFVSGVDMNNVNDAVSGVAKLSPAVFSALGRMNTHEYHSGAADPAKMAKYESLAQKVHKPVWMSEVGCCFKTQGDGTEMWGALFMADTMRMDLRDLGAENWVLWQPDWGVILFDPNGGAPQLKKQFYAIAQYSRFIRPGFQIISAGGAYYTLAAYSHFDETAGAGHDELGYGDAERSRPERVWRNSVVGRDLSHDSGPERESQRGKRQAFLEKTYRRRAAGALNHNPRDRWRLSTIWFCRVQQH